MKTSYLSISANIFLLFISMPNNAQEPSFEWVKQIRGTNDDKGNGLAIDKFGNTYAIGEFEGEVDFDPGVDSFILTSMGSKDIFIQKLDASGNLVWARQMGGLDFDIGRSIFVDAFENVYSTGYFEGEVDFDPGEEEFILGTNVITDTYNAFIQKLDSSGNLVWVKEIGGPFSEIGTSISVDGLGNIYTLGIYQVSADFDPGPDTFSLIPVGSSDIFIQKMDASGNFLWAKQMGGIKADFGLSMTVDDLGNIYTTGSFHETADFDPGPEVFNLSATSDWDIFIQKLDSDGSFSWAIQIGGVGWDSGNSIEVDKSGNIYVTGFFTYEVDFDPGPGTFYLDSGFNVTKHDIFVLKLNDTGQLIWAKRMGTDPSLDYGCSITLDTLGNVYTTGTYHGETDFDPGPDTYFLNLVEGGGADIFIQKLDSDGNFIWAVSTGGTSWDESNTIKVDNYKNIYTVGYFHESADFDPGLDTFILTSDGEADIFVHKMSQCPTSANFTSDLGFEICTGENINLTATGGTSYSWSTGDTTASIFISPTLTSNYSVTINNNDIGCFLIDEVQIAVETEPTAQFDFIVNVNLVEFNNLSSDNSISFEWNFGDNLSSTESDPSHTYLQSGNYTIQLIVFNDCGTDTIFQEIELDFSPLPIAAFSLDEGVGCSPLLVQFIDQSSGVIENWNWTFTGGTPNFSYEQNPQVIYETPGIYAVTLEVGNATGSNVITYEELISVDLPIFAAFDYSANEYVVTFTNTAQNATVFEWDFGDNTPLSTEENPIHTYQEPGVYLVTLVASNPYCGSAITDFVEIFPTSSKTFDRETLIEIYPNPVTNILIIESDIFFDNIQISNVLGIKVMNINELNDSKNINISDLSPGIYMIAFKVNNQVFTTTFIKQ